MTTRITSPLISNRHRHLRQGVAMRAILRLMARTLWSSGGVGMPNSSPPITQVFGHHTPHAMTIENYLEDIQQAAQLAGFVFEDIEIPLYLCPETTPDLIYAGAKSNLLKSAKHYAFNGTTGSHGSVPLFNLMNNGVLRAMEETGVRAKFHGEIAGILQHTGMHVCGEIPGLPSYLWFDQNLNAESLFYREVLPRVRDKFPDLKIDCEHITTPEAVDFVLQHDNVFATVCPQHLLNTVADLIRGMNTHLYCMPVVKFLMSLIRLLGAVTAADNTKFGMGDDDAMHLVGMKSTACGCAAGCCTTECSPQLCAEAFEQRLTCFGVQDLHGPEWQSFEHYMPAEAEAFFALPQVNLDTPQGQAVLLRFFSNGNRVHNIPLSRRTFTLERAEQIYRPERVDLEGTFIRQTINGPIEVDHDYIVQLPISMNWRKYTDGPNKGIDLPIEEQFGTTKWRIVS